MEQWSETDQEHAPEKPGTTGKCLEQKHCSRPSPEKKEEKRAGMLKEKEKDQGKTRMSGSLTQSYVFNTQEVLILKGNYRI